MLPDPQKWPKCLLSLPDSGWLHLMKGTCLLSPSSFLLSFGSAPISVTALLIRRASRVGTPNTIVTIFVLGSSISTQVVGVFTLLNRLNIHQPLQWHPVVLFWGLGFPPKSKCQQHGSPTKYWARHGFLVRNRATCFFSRRWKSTALGLCRMTTSH